MKNLEIPEKTGRVGRYDVTSFPQQGLSPGGGEGGRKVGAGGVKRVVECNKLKYIKGLEKLSGQLARVSFGLFHGLPLVSKMV